MSRFPRALFTLGIAALVAGMAWRVGRVPERPAVRVAVVARAASEHREQAPPALFRAETLHDWTARAPAAAWRWALARSPEDDSTWLRVLAWIAERDPMRAGRCAAELAQERPELAQIAHAAVLDTLAQGGDYASAARVLEQIQDGEVKNHLVTNLTLQWGRDDPLAAAEWLLGLPARFDRTSAFAQLGRTWAETQPQEAAEVLFRLPAGELRRCSLSAALLVWIEKNPAAASAWVGQIGPQRDLDLAAARISRLPALMSAHVDVALSWAESVVDANERTRALGSIIAVWADRDRAAAVRYVQNAPMLTPAQRASLLDDAGFDRGSL